MLHVCARTHVCGHVRTLSPSPPHPPSESAFPIFLSVLYFFVLSLTCSLSLPPPPLSVYLSLFLSLSLSHTHVFSFLPFRIIYTFSSKSLSDKHAQYFMYLYQTVCECKSRQVCLYMLHDSFTRKKTHPNVAWCIHSDTTYPYATWLIHGWHESCTPAFIGLPVSAIGWPRYVGCLKLQVWGLFPQKSH